jgi:methylated-DNA-protein-cysteine methyltransferase-like protein
MNFFDQVYELVRKIPVGYVTTYGEIAKALGTRDARRIGHALHANPSGDVTPCHRVVTKDGKLSESYAFGGSIEQYAKLHDEGVTFLDRTHVDLSKNLFRYP